MEWLERMNAVVEYLENNLTDSIDINHAADIAHCSTYHLQRVFLAVYGLSIAEYIRRRRLSMAARDLLSGNEKVIDIALKYGYSSPDSFSRAFRNLHSVTPQAAREPGVELVAFPRFRFLITLTRGSDMHYRIVEKPVFNMLVKSETILSNIFENYVIDPETWEKFWWKYWDGFYKDLRYIELNELAESKPGKITGAEYLGVTTIENNTDSFSYAVGIEKTGDNVPEGYEVVHVPQSVWAVFTSKGPNPKSIHDLEDRIFREWFPSLGYEHDSAPELEVYLPGDRESDDYRCEVWMPIVKR